MEAFSIHSFVDPAIAIFCAWSLSRCHSKRTVTSLNCQALVRTGHPTWGNLGRKKILFNRSFPERRKNKSSDQHSCSWASRLRLFFFFSACGSAAERAEWCVTGVGEGGGRRRRGRWAGGPTWTFAASVGCSCMRLHPEHWREEERYYRTGADKMRYPPF